MQEREIAANLTTESMVRQYNVDQAIWSIMEEMNMIARSQDAHRQPKGPEVKMVGDSHG